MTKPTFNLQPLLNGPTLSLRPLRAEDFSALYECARDPLVWEQHPQPTRYQPEVFRDFFDKGLASGGAMLASVDGRVVGSSRFYDLQADQVTIGYTFLARAYWGGRYNAEMKWLMLDHALQSVRRVLFEIGQSNRRSRRALEKVGGILLNEVTLDGKPYVTYFIDDLTTLNQFRRTHDLSRV